MEPIAFIPKEIRIEQHEADSVVLEMISLQSGSLEDAWQNVYIQFLVCKAIGREFHLHWGRVWRAEQSTHQSFAENLADSFILLSKEQLGGSGEIFTPKEFLDSLLMFSDRNLHYLYPTSIRGVREIEYSYYHRITCLALQTKMLYEHLISLGAGENIDTLRLALIISIRSKEDMRNEYESNVDLCLVTEYFTDKRLDFNDYVSTAAYRRFDLEKRLAYFSDQILLRDMYLRLDPDTRSRLEVTSVYTLGVSYDQVFRAYSGINDEEKRYSQYDMISMWGGSHELYKGTIELVLGHIQGMLAVQARHDNAFAYDRLEAAEVSLGVQTYTPEPVTYAFRTFEKMSSLTDSNRSELRMYDEMKAAEAYLEWLDKLDENGEVLSHFPTRSEFLLMQRVILQFKHEMKLQLMKGVHDYLGCYRRIACAEYDNLEDTAESYLSHFFDNLREEYPFRRTNFGNEKLDRYHIVRNLVVLTLGTSDILVEGDIDHGSIFRERVTSTDLLTNSSPIIDRLGIFLDELYYSQQTRSSGFQVRVARILEIPVSTVNALCLFLVLEVLLKGTESEIIKRNLAFSLGISEERLSNLSISYNGVDALTKIKDTFEFVSDALTFEKKKGVYSIGIIRKRGLAIRAALRELQRSDNPLYLTKGLLFLIVQGYTPTDLVSNLLSDKHQRKVIGMTLRESVKYLFDRGKSELVDTAGFEPAAFPM